MAENGLDGDVIGVAFDGTGYGTDGQIWGGEFLVARYAASSGTRIFVISRWPAAMPRCASPGARRHAGVGTSGPNACRDSGKRVRVVRRMIETGLNTIETSSCGRLFDAVASIIGLRQQITFEAQAAIELEMIADSTEAGALMDLR